MKNIIFMGTPEFAVPALKKLLDSRYNICAVYTQPPRPAGRGQKERKSPVHILAEENGIPIFTPPSLKDPQAQAEFANLKPDIAVVAAYGLILPQAILDAPTHGCINIHPSLLPRWRGAAPIQRTIMAGDSETAVCIMQMDSGLDTGDILLCKKFNVASLETAGQLHNRLSSAGAEMILDTLELIASGKATRVPQSTEGITYAAKITKQEAEIDFAKSATEIDCHIRGLNPYPGAYMMLKGEKIKIISATIEHSNPGQQHTHNHGEIDYKNFRITCADGFVQPQILQREGKKPVNIEDFLRGYRVQILI
jgi:methionyl-tRNA formyltransferase